MLSFRDYIAKRRVTDTRAGDFTADSKGLSDLPEYPENWNRLKGYLICRGACDEAVKAGYTVWRGYLAARGKVVDNSIMREYKKPCARNGAGGGAGNKMRPYRNECSDPKLNAQRNLSGRTHYVDDDTLRWHKSRVLSARAVDDGLLFAIVTSDALDMGNTKRGCRFVVFDVFGTVIERQDLEHTFRRSEQATKAMWAYLNAADAKAITLAAIERAEADFARKMVELREIVAKVGAKAAA